MEVFRCQIQFTIGPRRLVALQADKGLAPLDRLNNLAIVMILQASFPWVTRTQISRGVQRGTDTSLPGLISENAADTDREKIKAHPQARNKTKRPTNNPAHQERFSFRIIVSFFHDIHLPHAANIAANDATTP